MLHSSDPAVQEVVDAIRHLDPDGSRTARVLRDTFDQLYDGQRTGRYRWDQLYKTEKTHCGTLVEINLQRTFNFEDGFTLDYRIAGHEVDCKYSQRDGGWTIPPEADSHICVLLHADDASSRWSMGAVRIDDSRLNPGRNRDLKRTLSALGRRDIQWIFCQQPLPENVLLGLPRDVADKILSMAHGTRRLDALFRECIEVRVGRGAVATTARQLDFMRRVRANGGSRTSLRAEGIILLGQYSAHRTIASSLGVPEPGPGETVPVRVTPAEQAGPGVAEIAGAFWRKATPEDRSCLAPVLPKPKRDESLDV